MLKDNHKEQQQLIRASQQLAMLATLLNKNLITKSEYDLVKDSICRDYPIIVGISLDI